MTGEFTGSTTPQALASFFVTNADLRCLW